MDPSDFPIRIVNYDNDSESESDYEEHEFIFGDVHLSSDADDGEDAMSWDEFSDVEEDIETDIRSPTPVVSEEIASQNVRLNASQTETKQIETENVESEQIESEQIESEQIETDIRSPTPVVSEEIASQNVRLNASQTETKQIETENVESEQIESEQIESEQNDPIEIQQPEQILQVKMTGKYAINFNDLPKSFSDLLKEVEIFWTKQTNIDRQSTPLNSVSYAKCQERILCKYTYNSLCRCFGFKGLVKIGLLLLHVHT